VVFLHFGVAFLRPLLVLGFFFFVGVARKCVPSSVTCPIKYSRFFPQRFSYDFFSSFTDLDGARHPSPGESPLLRPRRLLSVLLRSGSHMLPMAGHV